MYYYMTSALMSLFVLIMTIIGLYLDSESKFYMFWGNAETYFCLGVSIVFIIIGFLSDRRKGD